MKILFTVLALLCLKAQASENAPVHNPFKKPKVMQSTSPISVSGTQQIHIVPDFALKATLVGGKQPLALIADEVVGVGHVVEGYKLVEVHEGVVVFEKDGVRQEVRVRDQELGRASKKQESSNE